MKHYSPTQISTFETCPKRYKFHYIDRIESSVENIEAFMGKIVHETLEKLYKDLIMSREIQLEDLIGFYQERWELNWHDGIRVVKEEYTPDDYYRTGKRCIEDYYRRYHPFNQDRTIGLELRVKIPINSDSRNPYTMIGIIDRLAYAGDGIYEIHDYKTSTKLPDVARLEQDRQLPLYQLAVEEMWRDVKEVRLVWHYLAFNKEITAIRTQADLNLLKEEVRGIIDRIEAEEEFLPVENPFCKWCDFQPICPLWKHLFKVEELSHEEYLQEDGVTLVNQFVRTKKKIKELEEELKMLEDALSAYAEREGVDVVFGDEYRVRVRKDKRWSFPLSSRDAEKRIELEEWLKRIKKWEEVSTLNTSRLNRVLKEESWKEKYIEKLREFARLEERRAFYLSKIREK